MGEVKLAMFLNSEPEHTGLWVSGEGKDGFYVRKKSTGLGSWEGSWDGPIYYSRGWQVVEDWGRKTAGKPWFENPKNKHYVFYDSDVGKWFFHTKGGDTLYYTSELELPAPGEKWRWKLWKYGPTKDDAKI